MVVGWRWVGFGGWECGWSDASDILDVCVE